MSVKDTVIRKLERVGVTSNQKYRHDELLPKYREVEQAMLKEVFQDSYSQNLTTRDLMDHLQHMAEDYSLTETEAYTGVMASLRSFSFELAALINGNKGERFAHKALNWLDTRNFRLENLELTYEDEPNEYDNIVITPGGIFIIEVKYSKTDMVIDQNGNYGSKGRNYGCTHNIGTQIQSKEYVLWKTLEQTFADILPRSSIRSIILCANNHSIIEDNFHHIPVRTCGDVNYYIKETSDSTPTLTAEQMRAIRDYLRSAETKTAYKPTFDFCTLFSRFTEMMTQIELATRQDEEPAPSTIEVPKVSLEQSTDSDWGFDWKSFFIGSGLTALGYAGYKGIRYALKFI